MVGKIGTGKSFRGCLNYLFQGRLQGTKEEQQITARQKQVEVIAHNQCFGDRLQLTREFIEVSKLNPKVSKPVFHISVSFAHADAGKLNAQDKADMVERLAKDFGFHNNQYVVIAHRDTGHEHLHVVANRIGYDGKTASDSNSYKRIAAYCRAMELEYGLTKVLSPNKFLRPERRVAQSQRVDQRKETLKRHLSQAVQQCGSVTDVKRYMEQQGYEVELGRGIAFTDVQQVRFKGSQVGYALLDIERKLKQQQQQKQAQPVREKEQTIKPSKGVRI
ncbi:relaxase/mobilization nuclease-like protein [Mucilaginibacter gracilis]|uniref:Relaxase/mobilization nuclease-like protein n=1 Tax=Mucilaginibacter gracilis TaxID=423350 RepID=A0A495J0J3_9SPHI|nr:relaxase/mobilization nuclease domain-containing protein [Mucilaginibacter gracilis]RKR81824.1 relaxase/mobilization nuclease-like protein [Mucilaginibacter gracilis]